HGRRAARLARYANADALCAVRVLDPGSRHFGVPRLLHAARGDRHLDRARGRARGRGAAHAATLGAPRSSRLAAGLTQKTSCTGVDDPLRPDHMRAAGTLRRRVPIGINQPKEEVITWHSVRCTTAFWSAA